MLAAPSFRSWLAAADTSRPPKLCPTRWIRKSLRSFRICVTSGASPCSPTVQARAIHLIVSDAVEQILGRTQYAAERASESGGGAAVVCAVAQKVGSLAELDNTCLDEIVFRVPQFVESVGTNPVPQDGRAGDEVPLPVVFEVAGVPGEARSPT